MTVVDAARPVRVLELRSISGTGGGPEKTILLGTARTDVNRFSILVCYLRAQGDDVSQIDDRARHLGVTYREILERRSIDPGIWRELTAIVDEFRPDIVHAHDYKTDVLAWLVARRRAVVPLATAHGWTGHSARERRLYYPLDKWVLARYPAVIAVSSDIKHELIRHGAQADRVRVVLNGIDHERFRRDPSRVSQARAQFAIPPGTIAIGSVGRLEHQKRFDLLLESFAAIRSVLPRAILLIAGDGSLKITLEAHAQRLGLGDSCRLTGHVGDIAALQHALDLFVQASDYEGTPNSVLEAMAFETPVVATKAGGTAELVRDGVEGLLVDAGDCDALARAIVHAVSDTPSSRHRAALARRRVETDLSFATRMRNIERVYIELTRAA